jgi:hypothetical protein
MDLVLFIMNGWFPMGLRIIHHYNVFRSVIFHHIYCFFSTAMLRRSQQWPHVSDLFSLHTIKHAFSCKHIYIYIATPFSPMSYFFCYIYILHIFIAGIYIHTYIYIHTHIYDAYMHGRIRGIPPFAVLYEDIARPWVFLEIGRPRHIFFNMVLKQKL